LLFEDLKKRYIMTSHSLCTRPARSWIFI